MISGIAGLGGLGLARSQGLGGLRAGAAASNITPPLGISLDGAIMHIGPARHVHDQLHARCLVLDDGGTRVAIVICDNTMISREVFDRAKTLVKEHTELAVDRMLMAATHAHSTPRGLDLGFGELNKEYLDFLARRIADCVRVALNNLAPARIGWGVGRKPEFVFNRRWLLKPGTVPADPFGASVDRVQMNPEAASLNLVRPAGPVDPEVAVLSVQHADGRPLALIANYGFHFAGGFVHGDVSADYFGMFATRISQLLGAEDQDPPFVGIMSNGTSGDVSGNDFSRPRPKVPPYVRMREVAEGLAREVFRVWSQIEYRDRVPLAMTESELELGVRQPDPERLAWARDRWAKARAKQQLTRPEIYAREAVLLSQYPGTLRLKLQALRIGDLGIAAVPCEVFAETGLAIKRESPLRPTFTIELANGYSGYLPTPGQHELGGYETWPARSSCLEVPAEPKIRARVLRLLKEVSGPVAVGRRSQ